MGWLRNWRRRRAARHLRISPAAWARAEQALPGLRRLEGEGRSALAAVAAGFLSEKRFEGIAGVELDRAACEAIALQAAVPVRHLGLDWYAPWTTVVVYPAGFVARHEYEDEDGIVHVEEGPLIGEAWEGGPLVLSLEDSLGPEAGTSVVIHECAHKLDMRQGVVNGLPPLPSEMSGAAWSSALSRAFEQIQAWAEAVEAGRADAEEAPIDLYAAEDPGEFFAVASETYFAEPRRLRAAFPAVFSQFEQFYGWRLG